MGSVIYACLLKKTSLVLSLYLFSLLDTRPFEPDVKTFFSSVHAGNFRFDSELCFVTAVLIDVV